MTVKLDWKNLTYIPVDFCILSLYSVELSLFEEKDEYEKIKKIDKVMFEINNKFGNNFIKFLNSNKK